MFPTNDDKPQGNTQQQVSSIATQDGSQQQPPSTAIQDASQGGVPAQVSQQPTAQPAQVQTIPVPPSDAFNYFNCGWFNYDIACYGSYANRKTGFSNLDQQQAFYPGLYIIGAVSSLGKTTFCHQLADQVAAQGEEVLYFSLEQSRFEMFSKSISRTFYLKSEHTPQYPRYSSIDIRKGLASANHPWELQDCVNTYVQSVGDRMRIIAPESSISVEEIKGIVENFALQTGKCPVVIIDYLQIIKPSTVDHRPLEARASIDHIVQAIKSMQKKYNLTVIVISSLNRQNYTLPIDFESFKESGGIEYTADVLWGLQLAAISQHPAFIGSKEASITVKRNVIKDEKSRIPRRIELVCLKNRYGSANYSMNFDYNPQYDTFIMPTSPGIQFP